MVKNRRSKRLQNSAPVSTSPLSDANIPHSKPANAVSVTEAACKLLLVLGEHADVHTCEKLKDMLCRNTPGLIVKSITRNGNKLLG